MKKIGNLIAVICILSLLLATESLAQREMKWKGNRRQGSEGQYGRGYNPKTVETISGEVVSVDKITPREGIVYLMVKTDKETLSVHLGPAQYIEEQKIKIEPKDKIEVRGSRITFEGKPTIIAAEVKRGGKILKLRDENGLPKWRGSSRWGAGGQYARGYDPKTVETISGEVVNVEKITPRKGIVYLMVKTDKETLSVHLGPARYIEEQKIKIEPKDKIEVRGSRITLRGEPTIIAAEVKREGKILRLRDENGFPVWIKRRR